jgi:hypothetical protein
LNRHRYPQKKLQGLSSGTPQPEIFGLILRDSTYACRRRIDPVPDIAPALAEALDLLRSPELGRFVFIRNSVQLIELKRQLRQFGNPAKRDCSESKSENGGQSVVHK